MAKYKQDSTQWVKANQAYQDSLKVYNGAVNNWESEIALEQKADDDDYKRLLTKPYFDSKEKATMREQLEKGRNRYITYDDVSKRPADYRIPTAASLSPTEYGYNRVKGGGYPSNLPTGIDDYTADIIINKGKVQPVALVSTSEGGSHGVFKKPTKAAIPPKPIKFTAAKNVNYDDTYENLNMRSL